MAKILPIKIENSFQVLAGHCEVSVIFKQKDTNAPIKVIKQAFNLKRKTGDIWENQSLRILKQFSPSGNKLGEYRVTFLADERLTPGDYMLEAIGYPEGYVDESDAIIYQENIQIYQVDNVATYMELLRIDLSDLFTRLFLIDDPTLNHWADGELYAALNRSVARYNESPPISRGTDRYNLDNFPHTDILLMGARLIALESKDILEIYNKLQYSDDITFTLNRFQDIMQELQRLGTIYYARVEKIKKYERFQMASLKAIRSTKIPTRALRSLSFTPQFSFLSAAY